jgi:hypothetical protein
VSPLFGIRPEVRRSHGPPRSRRFRRDILAVALVQRDLAYPSRRPHHHVRRRSTHPSASRSRASMRTRTPPGPRGDPARDRPGRPERSSTNCSTCSPEGPSAAGSQASCRRARAFIAAPCTPGEPFSVPPFVPRGNAAGEPRSPLTKRVGKTPLDLRAKIPFRGLVLRASVGSTEASSSLLARVGVVGPKSAEWPRDVRRSG